ncbi:hypothetical protein KKH13_02985 [Patescibacteria group bacterium]|nr:hypothetical protein [Patescibacteria group bacterium]
MPIGETLKKFFGAGRRQVQSRTGEFEIEGIGKKQIGFNDLREPDKAKERGVEPGFYLTANPITPQEIDNAFLLQMLTFQFFAKLGELGLMQKGDTVIPVDNTGEAVVDPSQGWLFSPAGYIQEMQLLVVQATPVDRDTNQTIIVQALSGKK